jgi:hypothetical protein
VRCIDVQQVAAITVGYNFGVKDKDKKNRNSTQIEVKTRELNERHTSPHPERKLTEGKFLGVRSDLFEVFGVKISYHFVGI